MDNTSIKLNTFMNIGNHPYLFNECIKQVYFKSVDPSIISNNIFIEQPSKNHTIVNILANDIVNEAGNKQKYEELLIAFPTNPSKNIDVLQKALLMEIHYQVENKRTGEIVRSFTIKSIIRNIEHFTNVNPDDINDNIVLTNSYDYVNTTISEYVHGSDRTICRVVDIDFSYLVIPEDFVNQWGDNIFYHFIDNYSHILMDSWRIEDKDTKTIKVPLGLVSIDRTFDVDIAHKVLFKVSMWRNDVIFVSDTTDIAKSIGVFQEPVLP